MDQYDLHTVYDRPHLFQTPPLTVAISIQLSAKLIHAAQVDN